MDSLNGTLDETGERGVSDAFVGLCIGLWTLMSALILAFNSMCLVLLQKVRGFSKPTLIFLKSLTIADLILGLGFYTPMVGVYADGRQWPFGSGCCLLQACLIRAVLPMTAVSILLVTVDRYTAIVHPMRYEAWLSPRRARLLTCLLWTLCLAYTVVSLCMKGWRAEFSPYYLICTIGKFGESSSTLTLVVMSVVVFLVIAAMYGQILLVARRHAAHIAHHRPSVTSFGSAGEQPPPSLNRKSFTTVFIITMTLLIGWLPSVVLGLTAERAEPSLFLVNLTQIPLASVSWLNVVVYYIRNRAFRETAAELYSQPVGYFKGCCRK